MAGTPAQAPQASGAELDIARKFEIPLNRFQIRLTWNTWNDDEKKMVTECLREANGFAGDPQQRIERFRSAFVERLPRLPVQNMGAEDENADQPKLNLIVDLLAVIFGVAAPNVQSETPTADGSPQLGLLLPPCEDPFYQPRCYGLIDSLDACKGPDFRPRSYADAIAHTKDAAVFYGKALPLRVDEGIEHWNNVIRNTKRPRSPTSDVSSVDGDTKTV